MQNLYANYILKNLLNPILIKPIPKNTKKTNVQKTFLGNA